MQTSDEGCAGSGASAGPEPLRKVVSTLQLSRIEPRAEPVGGSAARSPPGPGPAGNLWSLPRPGQTVNAAGPARGAGVSRRRPRIIAARRPAAAFPGGRSTLAELPTAAPPSLPLASAPPPFVSQDRRAAAQGRSLSRARRPARARATVSSSAYCRSAPAGSPWASRVILTPLRPSLSAR